VLAQLPVAAIVLAVLRRERISDDDGEGEDQTHKPHQVKLMGFFFWRQVVPREPRARAIDAQTARPESAQRAQAQLIRFDAAQQESAARFAP